MTLKSALQDLKENTLSAVSGLLGKLAYLASLRRTEGHYEHWGMEAVHGPESSERAMKTAHAEVVAGVLRTPMASMEKDLEESSGASGMRGDDFLKHLHSHLPELIPGERKDAPTASHLNSVLVTLSSLWAAKIRGRATRSTS